MKHPQLAPTHGPSGPLPDIMKPGLSAVFCGLNPGLRAAASGHHFAGHGNRFWRVIHLAGITDRELEPVDDRQLLSYGYGLTTAVSRPTASAAALSHNEYVDASVRLIIKLERFHPACVAFLGKAAYAAMTSQRVVPWGPQRRRMGGARVWVLPNPSGRNRAFSLAGLVDAYGEFRASVESQIRYGESPQCAEVDSLK
ncbi:G/U mismatch-specific DNA glycosylase [Cupriavidus pinatubonensis]|uniref:G/U mismatch-specific uracil-DNA glycosylase n=2 Tax=Burkholderiaceae TaxID=119060 RepID=Q46SQ2_CUPPJ|nr:MULTISPECIES: G/U mismatch-specific DNA glycosylase [Cupriavidus]QYY29946.1 G/U mismatch-specific DNA glycosylase [Cupriavidus pinatubonensis]TPQ36334.1 G/U mismatch-specific DNA glycosylase [Cupriavidus pinatubonensis]